MPVTWVIKDDIITRSVGDEMIVLNLESGDYHSLNAVGAAIYRTILRGASVDDVVNAVVTEFDVDAGSARLDIEHFLDEEARAGLVEQLQAL